MWKGREGIFAESKGAERGILGGERMRGDFRRSRGQREGILGGRKWVGECKVE